jgi:hypothetical protein
LQNLPLRVFFQALAAKSIGDRGIDDRAQFDDRAPSILA